MSEISGKITKLRRSCSALTSSTEKTNENTPGLSTTIPDVINEPEPAIRYKWGDYDDKTVEKNINDAYEKIVFWRKNIFMVPTGKAGKE